jgi:lipopolysaccharide transport system ATP-binding protein
VSAPAIRVSGLSKRFRIGERVRYKSLRESIQNAITAPFRRGRHAEETIWALRDVSFEVAPGKVVGVIGHNGAGKSTLLKVLSRITEPTEGRVELRGRVGSLLEVGTGFHLELTGRENIFLNGAILGMKRAEIASKFDEIVAFAEIDRFLDTPVKHYSTGMYLRLAFAVAAHLEPEILLVDEVLAVGDAAFQKKCLGKMGEVAGAGRTVLFVSHNMAAVAALCPRCLLLSEGRTNGMGPTEAILQSYLTDLSVNNKPQVDLRDRPRLLGSPPYLMRLVRLRSGDRLQSDGIQLFGDLEVDVEFESPVVVSSPVLGVVVKSEIGIPLFGINNRMVAGFEFPAAPSGTISCTIRRLPLRPGRYSLDLYFGTRDRDLDAVEDAISFEVMAGDPFGTGKLPAKDVGPFLLPAAFQLRREISS